MTETNSSRPSSSTNSSCAAPPPTSIPDLKSLHAHLIQIEKKLEDAIISSADDAISDALGDQITQVTRRSTIIGGLLFNLQSQALSQALQGVSDATADVNKTIQQAQSAIAVVDSITGYLKLVDNVIDVARKIVCV